MVRLALQLVVWSSLHYLDRLHAAKQPSWRDERVLVASIGGMDKITSRHIYSLMASNSIHCGMEGSLLYDVDVAPQEHARATQLLLRDALIRASNIRLLSETGRTTTNFSLGQLKTVIAAKSYPEALAEPAFSATTDLGRFLRNEKVMRLLTNFPHIVSFSANQRRYLESTNRWANGYDVELQLSRGAVADSEERFSQTMSFLPVAVSGTIGESLLAANPRSPEPCQLPSTAPSSARVRVHLQILSNGAAYVVFGGSDIPDYFR